MSSCGNCRFREGYIYIVGGFNRFGRRLVKLENLPQIRGEIFKKQMKPPPSWYSTGPCFFSASTELLQFDSLQLRLVPAPGVLFFLGAGLRRVSEKSHVNATIHPGKLTCPLKRDYFNRKYIFQPSVFRGYVSFQGVVGGWTNPSENMLVKMGSSSPSIGVKINNIRNQHLGNKRYDVFLFGGSMNDSVKLELEWKTTKFDIIIYMNYHWLSSCLETNIVAVVVFAVAA